MKQFGALLIALSGITTIMKLVKIVAYSLLLSVLLFALARSFVFTFDFVETSRKRPLEGEVPDRFPVLVLTTRADDTQAHVVYHWYLSQFLKNHPEHRFEIKQDELTKINKQLRGMDVVKSERDGVQRAAYGPGEVRILSDDGDSVILKVRGYPDNDRATVGYYQISQGQYRLLEYDFYLGPSLVIFVFGIWLGIISVLAGVTYLSLKFLKQRRHRPSSLNTLK